MLHEKLWKENIDLAQACLEHSFIQQLKDGTLNETVFKQYVAQDVFFLQTFFQAYALAAAKCGGEQEELRVYHDLMGGVLDELKLHAAYTERLGIEMQHIEPRNATKAYTDFLLHTAWHRGVGEILAAMVPCMRLYAFLGKELARFVHPGHPHKDWIETYAAEGFSDLAADLESLLDSVAPDIPAVHEVYRYAMQCELDFFSGALLISSL